MKKIRRLLIIWFLGVVAFQAQCQVNSPEVGMGASERGTLVFGENNWHLFKENTSYSGERLFKEMAAEFELSEGDSMVLTSSGTDEIGYRHYRYQQIHNGIPVENAVYCVHERDGRVVSTNGRIVQGLKAICNLESSEEVTFGVTAVRAGGLASFSSYSNGKDDTILVYTRKNDTGDFKASNYCLAFRVVAGDSIRYYDAETGRMIKTYTSHFYYDNCHNGIASTLYNGWQDITTKYENGYYHLIDLCRGAGILAQAGAIYPTVPNDNIWAMNTLDEKAAVSAFWAAEMAYDFFLFTYGRNSYDDNGSAIKIVTEYYNSNGAEWVSDENEIHCGVHYDDCGPFVSLDVIGHELTHGIVQYTSNMGNVGEAGALNESFADIFGAMVEFYVEGDAGDYIQGEDVTSTVTVLRSLSNPQIYYDPDTYHGTYWYTGNDPGDYIHDNCGVQNYWFYLLAEGGEGENDNGVTYSVQGIGREKAAKIAYRNMVYYMNSSCDYSDARNGAILSAADLFGHESAELQATIAAWNAVGVNNLGDLYYDYETDCDRLQAIHEDQELPVSVAAIHSIESDCQYVANQVPVIYCAGDYVLLTDGFYSGDDFTAFLIPEVLDRQSGIGEVEPEYCIGSGSNGESDVTGESVYVQPDEVSFAIYPNPSMYYVNVLSNEPITSIVLYDICGRQVYREVFQLGMEKDVRIDISSLARGVYMIEAKLSGGELVNKRLIKR